MELYWRSRSELTHWAERVLDIPGAADYPTAARCAGLAAGGYSWAQDRAGFDSVDRRFGHLDRQRVDFHRASLDQRWEDVLTEGEAAARQHEEAGYDFRGFCTRFASRTALLRLNRVSDYADWLEGVADDAHSRGLPTICRLSREGQSVAGALLGDHEGAAIRLGQAAAIETPPGTLTLVPVFGALEVFDRGGRTKAMSMMRSGIRSLIEADTMFWPGWRAPTSPR